MQTKYQNISFVQIPIQAGVSEYYLPKNVNWAGNKIERIAVFAPSTSMVSPMSGADVLQESEITDLYFDVYATDNSVITRRLHYSQFMYNNNHPVLIQSAISLDLSKMVFTTAPVKSGVLILYVFYNKHDVKECESTKNITVRFPLAPGEKLYFDNMIGRYMYAESHHVQRIVCWNSDAPAFITMRDTHEALTYDYLSTLLMRSPMNGGSAQDTQLVPLALDGADIDFAETYIVNTTEETQEHVIEFEY